MAKEAKRGLAMVNPSAVLKSRRVRDYALMTLGILIVAWGLNAFLIPNKLAAGGVSGLATVFYYLFQDRFGVTVPIGLQMLVMNGILLVIGIRAKGWRYGARTVYGMVLLSLAVDLLAPFVPHLAAHDQLLAVLYGGAVTGVGMGLVFKARGNTGGTDIVAQLLVEKVNLGVGQLMLLADAVVTLVAALVLGPDLALYGAVAVFIMGAVIDVVQEGLSVEKAAFIICDEPGRVADAVMHQLGRGATGIMARGLYSSDPREMVFTVVSRREIDALKALVHAVDPKAFVVIANVHEALGEGFKEIGAGL
ncbi:MAG: YitT family protein [Coriobacteriia bacterium]|nr:YitT family protein [Coriobacteriia bacterium]